MADTQTPKKKVETRQKSMELITLYEPLFRFNEQCGNIAELLILFQQRSVVLQKEFTYYVAMLDEIRSSISQSILEHLDEREIHLAGASERRRRNVERELLE